MKDKCKGTKRDGDKCDKPATFLGYCITHYRIFVMNNNKRRKRGE